MTVERETFAEEVERRREERETNPEACTHCGHETQELTNYSRTYGGNVGAHWLCKYCEVTHSASAQGAGLWHSVDSTVQDVVRLMWRLEERLKSDA